MDKLIITVTCDSTMSYPHNPHNPTPKGWRAVADEYVRGVNAGAAICHLHGPYTVDKEIQPDGTKLSDLDIPGWAKLRKMIEDNNSGQITQACAKGQFYGMQTFNQSLVKLFKDGLVTEEEVLAAASSPDDVKLAMRGIEQEIKTG